MSVQLTGTESLFQRLGRIGRSLYVLNRCQADLTAAFDQLDDAYEDTLRDVFAPADTALPPSVRSLPSVASVLASVAQSTVIRMVTADQPTVRPQIGPCLFELIRQMRATGQSVPACTVAASQASGLVTGNGVLLLTTKRGDGLQQENLTAEAARLTCVTDSYTGTATAGREAFTFAGAANSAGVFDWDYPQGSGATAAVSVSSPAANTSLANGDFATWAGSPLAATYWTAGTGTWGTHLVRDTDARSGSYSLRFVAGATLGAVYQEFNNSTTGTASVLLPWTSYAVNLFLRTKTGSAAAGVLTVELVDSTGTVITDEQGTPNSFTVNATALTTSWAAFNGVFRLPKVPPSTVRLRVRVSTALVGADVLVDDIVLTAVQSPYPGGPGVAIFAGTTAFAVNDYWTVTTANDRAGSLYLGTWQSLFDKLFGMRALGLLLPSSGSPTLADTLLTDDGAPLLDFSLAADSQFATAPSPVRI